MPNWCTNSIVIKHPDKAIMAKALLAWEENNFLSTFVPEPDYKKTVVLPTFPDVRGNNDPVNPVSAWWDWRIQNWGTKWELETKGTDTGEGESINAFFDSAWSPPVAAYVELTKQGFQIEAYFFEGGIGFCGKYTSDNGEESYDIKGDALWIEENIPKDIDEVMNISNNMAEFEEG